MNGYMIKQIPDDEQVALPDLGYNIFRHDRKDVYKVFKFLRNEKEKALDVLYAVHEVNCHPDPEQ